MADHDRAFEFKLNTQSQARAALIVFFRCGMLSFAYLIINFAKLSKCYIYEFVRFVVSVPVCCKRILAV
ncbi:hypothetical protein [Methanosarcina barkeri]|uniref:hypothetical protein n=1 Tax=Methanosarcina barkeri TaxID=2208 RepID=UPI0011875BF5|nr:hypothetical protein [Methanosarcina barkeri]